MSESFEFLFKDFEDAIRNYSKSEKVVKGFEELRKRQDQSFDHVLDSIFAQLVMMFGKNKDSKKGIKLILKVLDRTAKGGDDVGEIERFLIFVIKGGKVRDGDFRRACAWTICKSVPLLEKYKLSKKTHKKVLKLIRFLAIDKNHKIRKLACDISKNLYMQDLLLSSLSWEPHKKVTKFLIKSIHVNKKSSKSISKRLKDTDSDTRICALKALTKNNEFYCLDKIIPLIYNERDEKVRAIVIKTIENYLNQFSIIDLAKIFKLGKQSFYVQKCIIRSFEYICKEMVHIDKLLNTISLLLPRIQDLNVYELLVFRYSCSSLHEKDEYRLHSILSSPHQLKISDNLLKPSPAFIQNILKTLKYLDIGDEIIRNEVLLELKNLMMSIRLSFDNEKENILIENFLNKMNNDDFLATDQQDILIEIVKTCKFIIKDDNEFLAFLLEIINEIIDPLFNGLNESLWTQKEKLENNIERLENDLKAIRNDGKVLNDVEVYNESNRTNQRIQELENILKELNEKIYYLLVRACVLLCEVIKSTSFYLLPQFMYEVCKIIVQAGLKFEDNYVQAIALNCLGALCIKFPKQCLEFLNIFNTILRSQSIGYKEIVALIISVDFSMIYDKPHFLLASIIESIHFYSQSTNNHFRSVALEGLCKLFTIGRISQPDILSDLLLAYFMLDLKPQSKQILFTFFSNYSKVSQSNPKILADAYFFTLINLSRQGFILNQSLSSISSMNSFILALLDPESLTNQSFENFQFYLFSVLALEIYENKSGFFILKLLLSFKFHLFSSQQAAVALKIINDIRKLNFNKACSGTCDKIIQEIQTSILAEHITYQISLESNIKENYNFLQSRLHLYLSKRNLSAFIPSEYNKENLKSTKSIQSPLSHPIKKAKLSDPN